jgi:hypothetical protein
MENQDKLEVLNRKSFKKLAEKSIGSSLSVPLFTSKFKNLDGEEKFKVTVDKRVSQVYLQLLENRVKKLQRDESLQNKENERKRMKELEKMKKKERKIKEEEFFRSVKQMKMKDIQQIREKIGKMKDYHFQLMNDIKTHSIDSCRVINTERKAQKLSHLRIKSEISDLYRNENYKKAEKIRESVKKLEETRDIHWTSLKTDLKSKYQARIELEKQQKKELTQKMKALENEEELLLRKLGKSQLTSAQTS